MPSDEGAVQGVDVPGGGQLDLPRLQTEDDDLLRGSGAQPAAGPGGDEGSALGAAAVLRFPNLRKLSPRERVDALTDYIVETAIHRGNVEQLRLEAHVRMRDRHRELLDRPLGTTHRSKQAELDARRAMQPQVAKEYDAAKWLVDRCTEQIARLALDYEAASRAYTLLSGG